jgi:putative oxidoreductase
MNVPSIVSKNIEQLLLRPWIPTLPILLGRVTLGALLIHHGAPKVFGGVSGLAKHLSDLGWPLATVQAYLASYTEFLGGIFLVVGLFTRFSAVFNVGLFAIIVMVFHGSDPFQDKEAGLMYLVLSLMVLFSGPGRVSVDHYLFTKNATREQA